MFDTAKVNTKALDVAPVEQIAPKCANILVLAGMINDTAETIRSKLFSPQPLCDEKRQELYSVDDCLNNTRSILNSALGTLKDISERIG